MIAWEMASCCILWFSHKSWHNFDAVNIFGAMVIMDDDHSPVLYAPPTEKLNRQMPESPFKFKHPFSLHPNAMVQCNHHQHKNREVFLGKLPPCSDSQPCPVPWIPRPAHGPPTPSQSFVVNFNYVDHHIFMWALRPCQRPLIIKLNQAAKPHATAFSSALTYATQWVNEWSTFQGARFLPPTELCELLSLCHCNFGLRKNVISGRWFNCTWSGRELLSKVKISLAIFQIFNHSF